MGPLHRNIIWQIPVGASHPRCHVAVQFGIEVNHLHQAMDPGIGSPSTQGRDFLSRELFQRLLQFVLDGEAGALALPALIGLTVVGDTQSDSHCSVSVLAGILTPADILGGREFESKFKLSDVMSSGNSSFTLAGAFTAD